MSEARSKITVDKGVLLSYYDLIDSIFEGISDEANHITKICDMMRDAGTEREVTIAEVIDKTAKRIGDRVKIARSAFRPGDE